MAIATPTQPFEHLVLDFLAYLEFERGLSRNTLEAYRTSCSSARTSSAPAPTR
jgi:integrase/recombinase XerD